MKTTRELKAEMAGATRAQQAAEMRERDALIRAEKAERAQRDLTAELDRSHREVERLKVMVASAGLR